MARIIYSGLVSDVSGSVGGACFSRRQGTQSLTTRAPSKKVLSPALLTHHAIIARANQEWASLDSNAKKFWKQASLFQLPPGFHGRAASGNGRLFFLGWRMRCLHAGASCAFDVLPPTPVYTAAYFRMTLFSPGTSVTWFSYPIGGAPPYPRVAAWLSWPANGSQRPGRRWFKFWPVPGHESAASATNLDTVLFNVMGYPPELTALKTGNYPWKKEPLVRSFGVFASGRIGVMPVKSVSARPAGYYFTFPPFSPVFSGYAA